MKQKRSETKRRRRYVRLAVGVTAAALVCLTTLYLTVAFAPIPFVRNLRNLWIETAMTTGEHQWLATAFFPNSIVDEVMAALENPGSEALGGGSYLDTRPPETTAVTEKEREENSPQTTTTAADEPDLPEPKPEPAQPDDILDQANLVVGELDYAGYTVIVNDIDEGLYITEVTGVGYRGMPCLSTTLHGFLLAVPTAPTRGCVCRRCYWPMAPVAWD